MRITGYAFGGDPEDFGWIFGDPRPGRPAKTKNPLDNIVDTFELSPAGVERALHDGTAVTAYTISYETPDREAAIGHGVPEAILDAFELQALPTVGQTQYGYGWELSEFLSRKAVSIDDEQVEMNEELIKKISVFFEDELADRQDAEMDRLRRHLELPWQSTEIKSMGDEDKARLAFALANPDKPSPFSQDRLDHYKYELEKAAEEHAHDEEMLDTQVAPDRIRAFTEPFSAMVTGVAAGAGRPSAPSPPPQRAPAPAPAPAPEPSANGNGKEPSGKSEATKNRIKDYFH